MQKFEVASFIDPVPHGLDNYWLVKKDELAQEAAPTFYDISIDARRVPTQDEFDRTVQTATAFVKLSNGLLALIEEAKQAQKDIGPDALTTLLDGAMPKPASPD